MKIKITEIDSLTANALKQSDYHDEEIAILKEVLLYAQLRGNNQGVVKFIGKGMPRNPDAGDITVEKKPVSAKLNGHKNHGIIVVGKAVDMVLEKVSTTGFAMVGTSNTNTSCGGVEIESNLYIELKKAAGITP